MNYRLYSFVNFYLSSIQQGVQTAHLVAEMFLTNPTAEVSKVLHDWAKDDKTIIILNGGANVDIEDKFDFLSNNAGEFSWSAPVGSFKEDADSLANLITCCGVIVPESIWAAMDYKTALRNGIIDELSGHLPMSYFYKHDDGCLVSYDIYSADYNLIAMIKSCGLAR